MKWKIQVLKDMGWQDLNPEMFTFSGPKKAAEVAQRYNENRTSMCIVLWKWFNRWQPEPSVVPG